MARRPIAPKPPGMEIPVKWEGSVHETIPAPIDKVWKVIGDFDGVHRNFPQLFTSCETVEGQKNAVGSLRAVKCISPLDGSVIEARDRLLQNDAVRYVTWYRTERISVFGWTGHTAYITLRKVDSGQTTVNWSYELDPGTPGITKEGFIHTQTGFIRTVLQLLLTNLTCDSDQESTTTQE